jgi:ribosome-binding protein aMBF1 (putative translation factor)
MDGPMDVNELLGRLLQADREYRAAMKAAQAHGGDIVQVARRTLGLTQRELAERIGVHYTYISKIENGASTVSKPVLAKLARLLGGVPVDERRTLCLVLA